MNSAVVARLEGSGTKLRIKARVTGSKALYAGKGAGLLFFTVSVGEKFGGLALGSVPLPDGFSVDTGWTTFDLPGPAAGSPELGFGVVGYDLSCGGPAWTYRVWIESATIVP